MRDEKDKERIVSDDLNGNRYFSTQTALPEAQENLRLHVGLFLATAYTTTVAGMFMSPQLASIPMFEDWRIFDPRYLVYGLPFSADIADYFERTRDGALCDFAPVGRARVIALFYSLSIAYWDSGRGDQIAIPDSEPTGVNRYWCVWAYCRIFDVGDCVGCWSAHVESRGSA